jgi:hypothetical protein
MNNKTKIMHTLYTSAPHRTIFHFENLQKLEAKWGVWLDEQGRVHTYLKSHMYSIYCVYTNLYVQMHIL